MASYITKAWHAVLNIVFPRRCPFCDRVVEVGQSICPECAGSVHMIDGAVCSKCGQPLEDGRREYCYDCARKIHAYHTGKALYVYQGKVKESLYRFKYANRREYAIFYGEQAALKYGGWIKRCGVEAIVPIPLHKIRKRQRGYNQAELFAKELSRITGVPVRANLIVRSVNTRPQKELDDVNRKKNLKKAFTIPENIVQLKKILLVDDIYTTGSTVDAAAAMLKQAGVGEVYILCISIGRGF